MHTLAYGHECLVDRFGIATMRWTSFVPFLYVFFFLVNVIILVGIVVVVRGIDIVVVVVVVVVARR